MKKILSGNKNRFDTYLMKNSEKAILLDIAIDVKYLKGKRGKKGHENLGFVVSGINWNPRKVSTIYRKRFAIESSYRIRNQVKPNTSTKNATISYFYALISFLLKNIKEDLFRFDVFLLLIEDWIRRKLKMKTTVECLR